MGKYAFKDTDAADRKLIFDPQQGTITRRRSKERTRSVSCEEQIEN